MNKQVWLKSTTGELTLLTSMVTIWHHQVAYVRGPVIVSSVGHHDGLVLEDMKHDIIVSKVCSGGVG